MTGLPNRAAWSERLEHEVGQWQQHGNTLLLAMLDLDHFKHINDNYGHLAGDKVLKIIATVLRKRLRGTDFIARFGGEEFVLLMPATALVVGIKLLESLRAAIEACPFHFKGEPVTLTASIGVSAFKSGEHSDLVLKRADQALYRAKMPAATVSRRAGRAFVPFCLNDGLLPVWSQAVMRYACCIIVRRVLPSS